MEIKLRKADGWARYTDLYEMNFGNGKWYPVSRKNMEIEGSWEQQRNLLNALLLGLTATVKGSYSRKCKRLTLKV